MRSMKCQRRAAWRRIHGIPDDTGNDEDIDDRRSTGSHFHEAAATALISDDPVRAFDHAIATAPASEHDILRWLWDRHHELDATEPSAVSYRQTEYWGGVTLFVDRVDVDRNDQTIDARVADVFTAALDAAGREPDGTPAIIEHRTGGHVSEPVFETDLYAVAGALAVRSDRIAVHIHRLGLQDGPECERVVYEAKDLQAAVERLTVPAVMIAGWHPGERPRPEIHGGELVRVVSVPRAVREPPLKTATRRTEKPGRCWSSRCRVGP